MRSPSATSVPRCRHLCPTARVRSSSRRARSNGERSRVLCNWFRLPTCWLIMRPTWVLRHHLHPRPYDRRTTRRCRFPSTVSERPSLRRTTLPVMFRLSNRAKHHISPSNSSCPRDRRQQPVILDHPLRLRLLQMHQWSQDGRCRIPNDRIRNWPGSARYRGWILRR